MNNNKSTIAIAFIVAAIIIGLILRFYEQPIERESTNNSDYNVSYLFEKDGLKVYRFYDRGEYVYFTSEGNITNTIHEKK